MTAFLKMAKIKVMVVDDEDVVRGNFAGFLKLKGIEVREGGTVAEAIRGVGEFLPDIMLLDLKIEGDDPKTGLKVLEETKRLSPKTKVYILSGTVEGDFKDEIERLGGEGFISKPVSLGKLNEIIEGKK